MAPEKPAAGDSKNGQKNVVEALNVKKQPPPQSQEEIQTRRLVVASFWAIVIFLGLPIWWKTTAIYRAPLPLQEMIDWADGKVCRPVFPLRIALNAPSLPVQEAQHLLKTTQHALDDLNDFSAHHLRLLLAGSSTNQANASQAVTPNSEPESTQSTEEDEDIALSIKLIPGEKGKTPRAELQPYAPNLDVYYMPNQIPSSSSTSSPLATFIANELQNIFTEEAASLAYLLASAASQTPSPKTLSSELSNTLERRGTRSFKYAPTYHLTFSLFTPDSRPSSWDIESALQDFMAPLLASLAPISNFTVDTQLQLYSKFAPSVEPKHDEGKNIWTLRNEDLGGFINAAEWPLSPSIGAGPTVNFVLYVPSEKQSPLVIEGTGSNSWLVPQWGGVYILNPSTSQSKSAKKHGVVDEILTKEDMQPAFQTFSSQLLSLLGLPETPHSLPLRIQTLTRVRAASLLFSASSTLGALARLTLTLPSIAIPDSVAVSVSTTIAHLSSACSELREGRFAAALEAARIAEREAEKAFFERSMVGQVYFPEEHKVAVYLPLLGPVAVPLIMAGVKEVKRLREARGRGP